MPAQNDPKAKQERPEHTSDKHVEAAVEGTFPASDPPGSVVFQGARAVPPEELMHASGSKPQHGDNATLTARFDGPESAKLAMEALVRDGPVDRRCAEVERAGDAATVRLQVPQADRQRLGEMLQKQPGRVG